MEVVHINPFFFVMPSPIDVEPIKSFGPFDPMPDQKTMRTSCPGGFYVMWVPKLLLTPIKIRIFGP